MTPKLFFSSSNYPRLTCLQSLQNFLLRIQWDSCRPTCNALFLEQKACLLNILNSFFLNFTDAIWCFITLIYCWSLPEWCSPLPCLKPMVLLLVLSYKKYFGGLNKSFNKMAHIFFCLSLLYRVLYFQKMLLDYIVRGGPSSSYLFLSPEIGWYWLIVISESSS